MHLIAKIMNYQTKPGHLSNGEALRVANLDANRIAHLRTSSEKQRAKQAAIDKIKAGPLNWGKK